MHAHINFLANQLCPIAGLSYRVSSCLLMDVLLLIFNSFVNSKLSYCIEIWGNTPAVYLNKLFLMQTKIIGIINKKPFDYPTSELFKKTKILTIRKFMSLEC